MSVISLQAKNPMTKVLLSVLIFEFVCCALAIPVMINVDHLDMVTSAVWGGAVALLALIATATLRVPAIGYPLGWITQPAAVLLGLLSPGMWFVGGLFAGLWVVSFILGKRLEQLQARHTTGPAGG